jgi:Leucine-rich repeat (LRR) protein
MRFLPTGRDVLRCELVNSTWRSSNTCPSLPPMFLSTDMLNKASSACLQRNAHRLISLRAALLIEPEYNYNKEGPQHERAANKAALEVLAASAANLSSLIVENIGMRTQNAPWYQLTTLTRLELNNSGAAFLPATMGTLTGLQHLSINTFTQIESLASCFTGDPEPWVQQLTNLTKLSVNRTNRFSSIGGPLPSSLQELDLDKNPSFEHLPNSLAGMTELRSVTISGLILRALPHDIGNLPQLSKLCFNKCDRLEELPDTLAKSTSIRSVHVQCNTLHRCASAAAVLAA